MAQEVEIKIKAAVEGAQAAQTLGALKKALTELQQVAEETEIGSTQFQNLQTQIASTTNRLAETSDRLGDVGDKLRTLTGTPVERLNASFGLLKESIFNLDIDKAKIAVDGLVNSFTPLGPDGKVLTGLKGMGPVLSNLGSGVMSLGQNFLAMGRALLMNPIFLLAATLTAIGVGITALLNKLGLLAPMMNAIGSAVEYVSSMFDNLTEAIGLSTAASDKHLEKITELGEEERRQIRESYDARVATATALEGLDSRQIQQIEKVTGYYLQQDKTLSALQIERTRLLKDETDKEIKEYERIQEANGKLNDDQKKRLRELTKEHEGYVNDIIALETKKVKEIEGLQDDILESQINREQNDYKRAQMIRDRDIENSKKVADYRATLLTEMRLLENKTDAQSLAQREQLQRRINLLGDRMREQQMTAEIEYSKKVQELNAKSVAEKQRLEKERIENEKRLVKSQLETLIKENKFLVEETKKGSKERLTAEITRLNSVLLFEEQNSAKLELTYEDLQLKRQAVEKETQALITEFEANEYNKRLKNSEDHLKKIKIDQEILQKTKMINGSLELENTYILLNEELKAEKDKNQLLLEDVNLTEQEKQNLQKNTTLLEMSNLADFMTIWKAGYEERKAALEKFYTQQDELMAKDMLNTLTFDKKKIQIINDGFEQKKMVTNFYRDSEIEDERLRLMALLGLTAEEVENHSTFINTKAYIEQEYIKKGIELERQAAQRRQEIRNQELSDATTLTEMGLNSIQALTDVAFLVKMNKARGNAVEEEKLARKQFEVNKAFQVGAAIIDGIRAVQTSLAFAPVAIGPVPNPAGIASLAFTLITSAANIAKILATQYQSKTFSPAGGGASSAISGGAANVASGPSQTFTPAQFFGLGGQAPVNVGVGGPNIVGPQKVFVVETDITSVQRSVRGIEQRAEIE